MQKILFSGTMLVLLASFHIGKMTSKKLVYPGEVVAVLNNSKRRYFG